VWGGKRVHAIAYDYADFTDAEYAALRDSIEAHGLLVEIVLWNGEIIDGRNRARICQELGKTPRYRTFTGTEAEMRAHVTALNQHRRSRTAPLTPAEKRARVEAALRANPNRSNRRIAKEADSNRTTVGEIRTQLEATGDVSIPDTRADSKGRQQPARKPPKAQPSGSPKPMPVSKPTLSTDQEAQRGRTQDDASTPGAESAGEAASTPTTPPVPSDTLPAHPFEFPESVAEREAREAAKRKKVDDAASSLITLLALHPDVGAVLVAGTTRDTWEFLHKRFTSRRKDQDLCSRLAALRKWLEQVERALGKATRTDDNQPASASAPTAIEQTRTKDA
jgi:hypothetical protein